ncbi:MAG: cation transporter, partial [Micromonosporaceae bacterium]
MTDSAVETGAAGAEQQTELLIGGMTCATCAARIEKKLNRLDGVEATVNFATEKAKIRYALPVAIDDLIATVEQTGYTAELPAPPAGESAEGAAPEAGEVALTALRNRLLISAA